MRMNYDLKLLLFIITIHLLLAYACTDTILHCMELLQLLRYMWQPDCQCTVHHPARRISQHDFISNNSCLRAARPTTSMQPRILSSIRLQCICGLRLPWVSNVHLKRVQAVSGHLKSPQSVQSGYILLQAM